MTHIWKDDAFDGNSRMERGAFVISLDFELHWGVRDLLSTADYQDNLLGERTVIPRLLDLFASYQIHATWATVGFLFFDSRDALIAGCPRHRPQYLNAKLCPYRYLEQIGPNEDRDPYHFAPSLVTRIVSSPHQEVATHTFSHYYCLEAGQDGDQFREDLVAAIRIARSRGVTLRSIVFPRNQVNLAYLGICRELGLTAYRGNSGNWMYGAKSRHSSVQRAARLLDSYMNLSGHSCHSASQEDGTIFNVPASRFLRPYSCALPTANKLQVRRIQSGLSHAAKNGLVYHLWWHPHNFGVNTDENISMLASILDHFAELRHHHAIESLTMCEMAQRRSVYARE